MTIEERLRRALEVEARQVEADGDGWVRLQQKVRARRSMRRMSRVVLTAAAVVAVIAGVTSLVGRDNGRGLRVGPAEDGGGMPTDEPGTTASPRAANGVFAGIWPFTSEQEVQAYQAEPGPGTFFDGAATALEFARVYLGMPEPSTTSRFVASADGSSGGVALRAKPGSPMITRVELRRFGGGRGPFAVVGATAENIRAERPRTGEIVGPNIVVSGRSTAFEAQVDVEVRQDGQVFGEVLGRAFVLGGANGTMENFAGDITFDPPTASAGAVVFWTESADDGSVQEATVVRVGFGGSEPSGGLLRFSVFFHRGERLEQFGRETGQTKGVLRAALEALFEGPMPDQDGPGVSSLFSKETAGLLAGVTLRPDGTAVVDLADRVTNASTSTGSRRFLEQLNSTVFQFSTVTRIEYRLQGSCAAFWTWLQIGDCQLVERPK